MGHRNGGDLMAAPTYIELIDGVLHVKLPPGMRGLYGGYTFVWGGWRYTYTVSGWSAVDIRYGSDIKGTRRYGADLPWQISVIGPFQMQLPALPLALDLKPAAVWSTSAVGAWPSFHVDQRRLVQVTALVERTDGFLEVPLLDADDRPWLGTGTPPAMMVRKYAGSTTDYVLAPATADVAWTDANCFSRASGAFNADTATPGSLENRTFGDADALQVTLVPKSDPVSHWVLRIQNSSPTGSADPFCVLVHLLGEGYGTHAASSYERGTVNVAGTPGEEGGHSMTHLVWSGVGFQEAPSAAKLNERKFGRGAIDVESASPVTTEDIYLTTGGSAGLSSGTALFLHSDNTIVPMVMVLGDPTIGTWLSDQTDTSTYRPESTGMGAANTTASAQQNSLCTKAYQSSVTYEAATSDWKVSVTNEARDGTDPAGGASAYDRTFYVFSVGG